MRRRYERGPMCSLAPPPSLSLLFLSFLFFPFLSFSFLFFPLLSFPFLSSPSFPFLLCPFLSCAFLLFPFPSFFPTSLCGVLVFGSVSRRLLLLLLLLLVLLLLLLPPPPVITHTTCHQTTHTQLAHISHIQLVIIQLAHTQLNSHTTCSHIQLVIIQLAHTQLVLPDVHLRDRRGTWRHPPSFHVAGVALGHIHICFTWQAWHLRHWAGSGGAPGSQLTPWTPWTPRLFAWQAWHLVTSTFTLRGRRGTWRHRPSLCVADVALGDNLPLFCVAGVALGDIHLLSHTIFHTALSPIIFDTPSFTHNFFTHHL